MKRGGKFIASSAAIAVAACGGQQGKLEIQTELGRIATDLAGCGLPPGLLTNLRALYSARKKELAA